jgi:hypothetical protein
MMAHTKALVSNIVAAVPCERCKAAKGKACTPLSGSFPDHARPYVHEVRLRAYIDKQK